MLTTRPPKPSSNVILSGITRIILTVAMFLYSKPMFVVTTVWQAVCYRELGRHIRCFCTKKLVNGRLAITPKFETKRNSLYLIKMLRIS